MKRTLCTLMAATLASSAVHAIQINLYVDSAPNAYGSPGFDGWRSSAFAAAANGTFVNMANSSDPANVGTQDFAIEDVVVYSFGDLGKRMHFVYWVPGETTNSLTESGFELRLDYTWDDASYVQFDWYTPTTWMNYDKDGDQIIDGVVGTLGQAWWGAYGVNTPEALAADLAEWDPVNQSITVTARAGQTQTSLTAYHTVPETPMTALLLAMGLGGLMLNRRRGLS